MELDPDHRQLLIRELAPLLLQKDVDRLDALFERQGKEIEIAKVKLTEAQTARDKDPQDPRRRLATREAGRAVRDAEENQQTTSFELQIAASQAGAIGVMLDKLDVVLDFEKTKAFCNAEKKEALERSIASHDELGAKARKELEKIDKPDKPE